MRGTAARSADELAEEAGCHPRLVREWLDGQAAAGLVEYDPEADRVLAERGGGDGAGGRHLAGVRGPGDERARVDVHGLEKIKAAFTGDGALAWGDHHPCLFKGTEWFFRTGYRAYLPSEWIPALDGVEAKLSAGARVADVGCGHGASVVVMAHAYPAARFWGFDYHAPSIETARDRAVRPVWRTAPRSRSPTPRSIRERTI